MAIYRNIQMSFWTDTKIIDDFTPEDRYFYLYLFTNPHTNLCGCYEITIKTISNETGYSKDTIERLIDRFANIHKVIIYSRKTKEVLLVNWHKYNWTTSPKLRKPLKREIGNIKNKEFRQFLSDTFNGTDTVSIPYDYGIDTTVTDTDTVSVTVEKKESDEFLHDDFDLEGAWKKIRDLYPKTRRNGMTMAKLKFLDLFKGVFNQRELAILIARAVDLYKKDCVEQGDENFKYVPNMDKWFEESAEYWIEKAEEYERRKENGTTTQSDE